VNYELGGRLTFRGVSGHLAAFLREGRNLIDWIRFEGSDTTKAANITQLKIRGLESSWGFDFDKIFNKKGLPVVGLSYAFMESDTLSRGFESNYVLDFLRHKVGLTVRQPLTETVNLSVSFSHQKRIGSFRSVGEMRAFEPFSLLDVRLAHTDSHVTLFAEVTNLLNQRVSDIGNVLLPGRWLRAGIAVNVSAKKASDLR
jgi:vitamin B12 transporter